MKALIKYVFILCLLQLVTSLYPNLTPLPPAGGASLNRIKAGFSIDSVARVDSAASLGINTAFIYGTIFTPSDPVGAEMKAKGMHEIDAGLSVDLFYYECHRTHTVAPPVGTANIYCATDVNPSMSSVTVLLAAIDARLQADAANPLIIGFWVLDDWPYWWDAGSARTVLQVIHTHIAQYTPHMPAICGIQINIDLPGVNSWDPRLALNYSSAGCDMIGIYAYAKMYPAYTNGSQFDFTMSAPLAAAFKTLQSLGWNNRATPLIGIGQAFAGSFGGTIYQAGLTHQQMIAQATAFCKAGAVSMAWYAWDSSGFNSQSLTPMTSTDIQNGITGGITACQSMWGVRNPI